MPFILQHITGMSVSFTLRLYRFSKDKPQLSAAASGTLVLFSRSSLVTVEYFLLELLDTGQHFLTGGLASAGTGVCF